MENNVKKYIILFAFFVSNLVFAQNETQTLQSKLRSIKTLQASFSQVVSSKSRQVSRSSGTMSLSRPGKFRWQINNPSSQLVIADGSKLWVYDKDLKQATVKKQQGNVGGMAGVFLSESVDQIISSFRVREIKNGSKQTFELVRKSSKGSFQKVKLDFSGSSLTGMEFFDQLGQRTSVRLSNVRINPQLSASLFKFSPPKGVDVVRQ